MFLPALLRRMCVRMCVNSMLSLQLQTAKHVFMQAHFCLQ